MELTALTAFCRRVEADLTPAQRMLVRARQAERMSITAAEWTGILDHNVDVALLRQIHRAVTGALPMTRRADVTGTWGVVPSRPGHVRSQPQSFRAAGHVEPAWDHATLKRRLAGLMSAVVADAAALPATQSARVLWALTRAQPFAGDNLRVAIVVASRLLASAGLPSLCIAELECDPTFEAALIRATGDQCDELTAVMTRAIWDESLATTEWLGAAPASERDRWSLADEHRALEAARGRARSVPPSELEHLMKHTADALVPVLESRLAAFLVARAPVESTTFASRLRAAEAAAARGRRLCPHQTVYERSWPVGDGCGLQLALVTGSAGRGVTGAAAMHVALELPGVPLPRRAPGMLIIPDESHEQWQQRLAAWIPDAVESMLRDSPLR
ncbi:MAG: hypothetical protein AB7P03_03540 [Kofleriaceae bacterium]